jgi:hypothetical protein
MTQDSLGLALEALGQRQADRTLLAKAVRSFKGALDVFRAANLTNYIQFTEVQLLRVRKELDGRRVRLGVKP